MSLAEVAALVGGTVVGDPTLRVRAVAPLEQSGPDELGLLADRRYLGALAAGAGGPLLVSAALADHAGARPAVVVEDAHAALALLLERFHKTEPFLPRVHATAVIGAGVKLGKDVQVGPYAVLEDDCAVGDRARVGAHAVIGRGARVGADAVLHPHVVLYAGTRVGERVILHAGVRLGSDGFGYAFLEGGYRKIPQVGGCVVEDDVEIGANSCVDRGSIGSTIIGRGSKLDNLVHVAHNVRLGPMCALAALVGIAGSTRVGRGAVFGGQSGAIGHLDIGDGARITAQAGVTNDVAAGETVAGFPARESRGFMKGAALVLRLPDVMKRLRAVERRIGAGRAEEPGGAPDGPADSTRGATVG
jgi:UDP-3-O-[3-hydroxymyristoyl] glucosamine N-acyltransferase